MKCNTSSHPLHYCRVEKIAESLLFLSCGDLTGQQKDKLLGNSYPVLENSWATLGQLPGQYGRDVLLRLNGTEQ